MRGVRRDVLLEFLDEFMRQERASENKFDAILVAIALEYQER